MNVEVVILDLTPRGAQVAIGEGPPFWLPRSGPGIEWAAQPEIGDVTYVRVPAWLVAKHQQLQSLRYQQSLAFHQPPGLDPAKAKEPLPMAYDNDMSGALFKNSRKEKPSHPDYQGKAELHGRKFWISAWIKTSEKDGSKYMSLSFKPVEDQRQQQPDRQQQRPAGGQSFAEPDIPFGPEVRV